jgi:hypothetical protein
MNDQDRQGAEGQAVTNTRKRTSGFLQISKLERPTIESAGMTYLDATIKLSIVAEDVPAILGRLAVHVASGNEYSVELDIDVCMINSFGVGFDGQCALCCRPYDDDGTPAIWERITPERS